MSEVISVIIKILLSLGIVILTNIAKNIYNSIDKEFLNTFGFNL